MQLQERFIVSVLLALFVLLTMSGTQAANAKVYVSTRGNDAWSGRLAAPNSTGTDGPFASLERACHAARATSDKKVIVRSGTYYLSKTLQLTPADNGLSLSNFPGESPTISGGQPLKLAKNSSGIYQAKIPEQVTVRPRLIRVGTHFLPMSTLPAQAGSQSANSWLYVERRETNQLNGENEISFRRGDIGSLNTVDLEVVIFPDGGWLNEIWSVQRIDTNLARLYAKSRGNSLAVQPGNRFYLRNVREVLSRQPNTWCCDTTTNSIQLNLSNSQSTTQVVVPVLTRLIDIAGNGPNDFVRDISISGLEFRDCAYGAPSMEPFGLRECAIHLSSAVHCKVVDNRLTTLGANAINIERLSHGNSVEHNLIEEIGATAVSLSGNNSDMPYENQINDNLIRNCGVVFKHSAGISCDSSRNNLIVHNKISNMPRYGISLKSGSSGSISKSNRIEKNYIQNTNMQTCDSGAIEILGRGKKDTGDVISGNTIVGTGGYTSDSAGQLKSTHLTWGVYLDDFASGITVSSNRFSQCSDAAIFVHGGRNNVITNNLLVDNQNSQVRVETAPADPQLLGANNFTSNIIVLPSADSKLYSQPYPIKQNPWAAVDSNVYWCSNPAFVQSPTLTPAGNYSRWKSAGYDRKSLVANPLVSNFSVPPNSPAAQVGFKPLPPVDGNDSNYGPRRR